MKLDDRDIVCETDLSDHEFEAALDAAIETGNPDARVKVVEMYYESRMETAYAYQRATSADSRFEVTYADNRAALARAEAAEAERDDANIEVALEQANAREAWERVAELEAQLAWRPGSENPPAPDWYQVGDIGVGVYDLWYSGEAWHRSSFQGATYRTPPMSAPDYWRPIPPLPPAPAPQEPTP